MYNVNLVNVVQVLCETFFDLKKQQNNVQQGVMVLQSRYVCVVKKYQIH
jgi:hypothetical protein